MAFPLVTRANVYNILKRKKKEKKKTKKQQQQKGKGEQQEQLERTVWLRGNVVYDVRFSRHPFFPTLYKSSSSSV